MDIDKNSLYSNLVVINSELHKDFKVAPVKDFSFVKDLNFCVVMGEELFDVARCYPIVFSQTVKDGLMPVAMLGVDRNIFVDEQGNWKKDFYIPAFVRRYPFILVEPEKREDGDDRLFVAIDGSYKGLNTEDGERLFDENGQNTPVFNEAIAFLRAYNRSYEVTKEFVKILEELNLFSGVDANINLPGGKTYVIKNLLAIDEEKLLTLEDNRLLSLIKGKEERRGYLGWIYAHILSLRNFDRIASVQ